MIFVTLGSQKFQFNRLLKAVDSLVESDAIKDIVFAQIGYSDYIPRYYESKQFLNRDEYIEMENKADIIITHGGTGAIMGAIKKGKKVIAVPRLAKYGEHVDDHQLQLIRQFTRSNLIASCLDLEQLGDVVRETENRNFEKYVSNTQKYIEEIDRFLSI